MLTILTHLTNMVIVPVLLADSENEDSYDTSMEVFAEAGPSHSRTSEITPEQASLHFLLDFILLVGGELKYKQIQHLHQYHCLFSKS